MKCQRVNVDNLGISELKWTGMGEFNSNDHYIYYCGQESIRRNAVLGCNFKNDRMISVHFQGTPLNITVIQVYAPTSNTEEAEVKRSYEDLQDRACFGSTYTKIGMIQRLAWPLSKDDTQISETFHIFLRKKKQLFI